MIDMNRSLWRRSIRWTSSCTTMYHEKLDEDLREELPLTRGWTWASRDDADEDE